MTHQQRQPNDPLAKVDQRTARAHYEFLNECLTILSDLYTYLTTMQDNEKKSYLKSDIYKDSNQRLLKKIQKRTFDLELEIPTLHSLFHQYGFRPKHNRDSAPLNIVGIRLPNGEDVVIKPSDKTSYRGEVDVLINGGILGELVKRVFTQATADKFNDGNREALGRIQIGNLPENWLKGNMTLYPVSREPNETGIRLERGR